MSTMMAQVNSPRVRYDPDAIRSEYKYESVNVIKNPNGVSIITPNSTDLEIETLRKVPRFGLMIVGWGGNNGTTFTGMVLANKHNITWRTKKGIQEPNFFGSVSQVGTCPFGLDADGSEVFMPIKNLLPMVNPVDIVLDGWDISSMDLGHAMERAEVFEPELQSKLFPYMKSMKPRRAIFSQAFVASNQIERADNLIEGTNMEQLKQIRADIRDFKAKENLEKIIVFWVGNTEKFVEIVPGFNDTWSGLEKALKSNTEEISPSTIYAIASVLEDCAFINGSPQNTLVPGLLELAQSKGVDVVGDDLKTGQTKLKSVLMDYLIGAGLRPDSIVSYNHLGNNDGYNLSAPHTFNSKEISKKGVVEDFVASNKLLYPEGTHGPDHLVVIKYVPFVSDSKRAMDEYVSSIAMGGFNTLTINNVCEDSLLATTVMLDLVIFMELLQRMSVKDRGVEVKLPLGTLLGYWLKAPLHTTTNSLFRQRAGLENLIRAALSLPPNNQVHLCSLLDGNYHSAKSIPKKVMNGQIVKKSCIEGNGDHREIVNGYRNGA